MKKSNWDKLKTKVSLKSRELKPPQNSLEVHDHGKYGTSSGSGSSQQKNKDGTTSINDIDYTSKFSRKQKDRYVGLDCEMVGIGPDGKKSALARCCVVDFDGKVVYDKFVRPPDLVVDFRTKYSGVRKKDLRAGSAIPLPQVCHTFNSSSTSHESGEQSPAKTVRRMVPV